MKHRPSLLLDSRGFTFSEMVISMGIGLVLTGLLVVSSVALYKNIAASNQYLFSINNGNRLIDYVTNDLRRAVRVGTLDSGTYTALKNNASVTITESNILTINIPDYYSSNLPDNAFGSAYKTRRHNRNTLNTNAAYNSNPAGSLLNGCVPWNDAVMSVNRRQLVRYAPASIGSGEIQVRYYRGPRSAQDSTPCFFRAEYPSDSNTAFSAPRDIAERISDSATSLVITVPNLQITDSDYGRTFTLESRFAPRFRFSNTSTTNTAQTVSVMLRNIRRD